VHPEQPRAGADGRDAHRLVRDQVDGDVAVERLVALADGAADLQGGEVAVADVERVVRADLVVGAEALERGGRGREGVVVVLDVRAAGVAVRLVGGVRARVGGGVAVGLLLR
jgi:hypothetical protein